ncbi:MULTISPECIES: NUDIX domain-containing protein [unclassified Gordonia (in: high G+C Gram-positive bacteria)]|uniref:NUDIX domain-containing protein n=1 Tax=unclassified Gordonia (in: high G+C Gram-positive bacteria) TaxID=2657482 RepID=UPI001F10E31F|nr:NUDIX domain-containing protein [Gordonia sp. ABSL49_1]MCH5642327.1 NUDIX domain-containing protein [Gordonia sp. ABSL49_1]
MAHGSKRSAGILLYRRSDDGVDVLVAHPGGPLWARKDDGAWSIPKGLVEPDESAWETARREFAEEIGSSVPDGGHIDLGEVTLKSGKVVVAFGVEGDLDVTTVRSNTFEMVWPPRSGQMQSFPEIDRAEWMSPDTARRKLNPAQAAFVDRLLDLLASR